MGRELGFDRGGERNREVLKKVGLFVFGRVCVGACDCACWFVYAHVHAVMFVCGIVCGVCMCAELPTVTFWPYFDTVTLKITEIRSVKKNTAANLPKITAV